MFQDKELKWKNEELLNLKSRILSLRPDQIGALLNLAGLNFNLREIKDVVDDIVQNKYQSGHLEILIYEAKSKNDLLFWIDFFEQFNTKNNK